MKMIKAIIRPERIDFVKKAMEDSGFYAITISEVMGRGDQKGISLQYRGGVMAIDLLPKVKIEAVVKDSDADIVVEIIEKSARTGKIGDGKIFVIPIERSIRVRTGEVEV
jgi:nitrogen regulatory protein P-II 1